MDKGRYGVLGVTAVREVLRRTEGRRTRTSRECVETLCVRVLEVERRRTDRDSSDSRIELMLILEAGVSNAELIRDSCVRSEAMEEGGIGVGLRVLARQPALCVRFSLGLCLIFRV